MEQERIDKIKLSVSQRMGLKQAYILDSYVVLTEDMVPLLECAEFNENNPEQESEASWVKVPGVQVLKDLTPITHGSYIPDELGWKEVEKDIKGGVTFAFFWNQGRLCWER